MSALRFRRSAVAALALALLTAGALAETAAPTPAVTEALHAPPGAARRRRGPPRRAGDHHRIRLADLQPLRRLPPGRLAGAEGEIRRRRQGQVHPARIPARSAGGGRLHARPLRGPEKRVAVIDRLFDHQADWAFTANPLFHLKEQLIAAGMSEADFEACLKNQALFDKVRAMHDNAAAELGINSTPTFFVDGRRLSGEQRLDPFDEILAAPAH